MASGDNPGLDILLRAILDARGFEDLKTRLKEAQAQASESASGPNEFKDALSGLGTQLLAATGLAMGAAEAVSFLKSSFMDYVEASRLLDQFAAVNRSVGGALGDSTEANEKWLSSVEMASGKTKTEIVPAYMKLVEVTGSVGQAQQVTQIALGASARGMGNAGEAATLLGRFLLKPDGPVRGHSALAFEINNMVKAGIPAEEIMKKLKKEYGDAGLAVHNAGIEVDRAKVGWEHTKEAVGSLASGMVTGLAPALKIVSEGIGGLISFFNYLLVPVKVLGTTLGQVGASVYHLFTGQFKLAFEDIGTDLNTKVKKIGTDAVQFNSEMMAKIKKGWDTYASVLNASDEDIKVKHTKAQVDMEAVELERYQTSIKWAKLAAENEIKGIQDVARIYKAMSNDKALSEKARLDAAIKYQEEEKRLHDALTKQTNEEIAQLKLIDKGYQELDKEIKKEEDERVKAYDKNAKRSIDYWKVEHKNDADYLVAYEAMLNKMVVDWSGSKDEEERISLEAAKTQEQIDKDAADFKNATIASGINALGDAFGIQKELSIVQAGINTAEGATKALAQGGILGAALAAIVIAMGLVEVAKIESATAPSTSGFTGPKGGFDDPVNDYAARMGGRKWAQDLIEQTGAGFREGLSGGFGGSSSSSITNNVSNRGGDRHMHAHIHAGIFDSSSDVQKRQLVKQLAPYLNVLDQGRTLR
jgi:hypothetical protein